MDNGGILMEVKVNQLTPELFLDLYTSEAIGFYKKKGFEERPCE